MNEVVVTTGSRLHFGLLCGAPDSGWHYGGIGLMVDAPSWQLSLSITNDTEDRIVASAAVSERTGSIIRSFRQTTDSLTEHGVSCHIREEVPFHNGLGSGTQLTLGLAAGLTVLSGNGRPQSIATVAEKLGRSRRSAVGTFGFDHGGFVIDRGRSGDDGRECSRLAFPEDWRLVLITPEKSAGLSGAAEESFFGDASYFEAAALTAIASIIEEGICPALQHQNFEQFCSAVGEYGNLVGRYYSQGQGGVYSSPVIRNLAEWLTGEGCPVPVQSSWGPTVAVPAISQESAEQLVQLISNKSTNEPLRITTTSARNVGATVSTTSPESQRTFG